MDLHKHQIGAYLKSAGKGKANPAKADPPPKGAKTAGLVKSTSPKADKPKADKSTSKPSRTDIAKYLILIGPEEASNILQHLDETEVEALAREISATSHITADEAELVLDRFKGLVRGTMPIATSGGLERAKSMLVAAFGEVRGQQIFKQALPTKEEPLFGYLADLDAQQINMLVRPESPAVKSIVLAYMQPPAAAAVLKLLSSDEQRQVISRMATMKRIDKEVLVKIDEALRERLHEAATTSSEEVDGRSSLANIMRHLDPGLEQSLLETLADQDPELAREIGDRLFTIDTLLLIEDRDLQKVLSGMEDRHIALILKGKAEEIRRKVLTNVSEARATQISEEYHLMGPQPKRDVDQATRDFIAVLKTLESEGKITVRREDEEYV